MRPRRRNRKTRAGFTLLEMMCALAVATTGLFGVLQLYSVAMEKTRAVQEYAIATRALGNEIETLRTLPFDTLEEGKDLPFRSVTPELERLVNVKTTVAIADRSAEAPGLKRVRARVRWTGEHGRTISKTLSTIIAKKR